MKIGIVSDLHIDGNEKALKAGETFEELLLEVLMEKNVDKLLIAGDISNHFETSQKFIHSVQEQSNIPVFFVPGNHDYWAKTHDIIDTNKVDDFFREQKESLVGNPQIFSDNWALVGTPGWYDYGYGNHGVYSIKEFEKKKYRFASWNDRHYVDWKKSDLEVSRLMLEQLEKDIATVGDRNILLMTHVATHPEFIVPLPHRIYDYANAFLGAKSYEVLYKKYPNIRYSVMGHVHFRKTYYENGTTFIAACLGNKKHWRTKDVKSQLGKTLVVLDL